MANEICRTMGWPAPGHRELLDISFDGHVVASLSGARGGYYEGLYLVNRYGNQYGPCFSVADPRPAETIKSGLANKLGIKVDELNRLSVAVVQRK